MITLVRRVALLALLWMGCRHRRAPVVMDEAPPVVVEEPAAVEPPSLAQPQAAPLLPQPTGKPPSADEVRARTAPLFPEIGRCLAQADAPPKEGWLQLRFVIQPRTGNCAAVQIVGAPSAQPCAAEVLRQFHVEPFAGEALYVSLPMSRLGVPMRESELPDSGIVR
jgi:hypothetical protein